MVPSSSADGSIVSTAPPWPVPLSHSGCQSSYKENSQQLLQREKNKKKHSTKITDTVMLSRLIYKKSFWCEMSPWWEALKWQQWSLRHRDYVVWEHISNWWVKGILIIFKPGDSFSVQNLSSIYFFHCCVTETVLPKASPLLFCPIPQNSCHKYFVIYSKGNKESFLKHHVHSSVYFTLFTMFSATSEWTWIQ